MTLDLLGELLDRARGAGCDDADAVLLSQTALSVQRRLGRTEHLERAEGHDLGLRVFIGKRSAIVSATSVDPAHFRTLAERAVAMARVVPEDPFGGLADLSAPPQDATALDLVDSTELDAASLAERAAQAEEAALAVAGVTNSEGADASCSRTKFFLATSAGFAGCYGRTSHSISATAVAGAGTGMQRDYDYTSGCHLADLDSPATIGRSAAERALARLRPTRPRTNQMTVVYDPRVSGSLLGSLLAAINGAAVARGTSFLKERLGEQIFGPTITIRDNPHRRRGPRSRLFDGEGVPTSPRALVDGGRITTWLLDSRSGRQLGMHTTGHAARSAGSPPSPAPTNLYLEPGQETPTQLMADIREGLYVTEMIGGGVNGVTGDYSRGASGFMIRNGSIAEPVAEITVAGHILDAFKTLRPANDLTFRRGVDAPTIRVEGLIVAGS